jgi:acetyl-CoA acetyltransferase
MRDVAIVSFAQLPSVKAIDAADEPELVQPVTSAAMKQVDLTQDDIGFTCSGSTDYLPGRPFSFVAAVDGLKACPPIRESHVEMDGGFALYEAWVRLLHGDIDTALVFSFGKSSLGPVPDVLNLQNDPYYVQPLGLDAISAAALQAQALIDAGKARERDFAEIAASKELLPTAFGCCGSRRARCRRQSEGAREAARLDSRDGSQDGASRAGAARPDHVALNEAGG